MSNAYRFCPNCATPLEWLPAMEDGGAKERLRCVGCGWTHWNNPTPVLAAVIECADRDGRLLLATQRGLEGQHVRADHRLHGGRRERRRKASRARSPKKPRCRSRR